MAWGVLKLGAMNLVEMDILDDVTNMNTGVRSVRFQGRETVPGMTAAQLSAVQEDVGTLMGKVMPVKFQRKTEYDGYYELADINTQFEKWAEGAAQSRWSLSLSFLGPSNAVEIESSLSDIVRANDFTLPGERWHAPAMGHTSYRVGASVPGIVIRTGEAGPVIVYRDIPAGVNPRWSASVSAFISARARVKVSGLERVGTGIQAVGTGWEVDNGLVRVRPGGGTLLVGTYSGGAWHDKDWSVYHSTGNLVSSFDQMAIIRNDPESVVVRLIKDLAPGAVYLDLNLRRGSRFVEGFIQRTVAASGVSVRRTALEANTNNSASGYIVASANDADGNRFVIGSARTFTAHSNGGITRDATATLGFFLGAVVGGSSAVAGDTAVDLRDQYIGAMPEKTGVSRR